MIYNEAIEKLGNREQKKIANNTYLVRRNDGAVAIRLHATDILTFRPDGTVEIRTNGWRSVTTKARLNDYLPCWQIRQTAYVWHYGSTKTEVEEGDIMELNGTVRRANGELAAAGIRTQ